MDVRIELAFILQTGVSIVSPQRPEGGETQQPSGFPV